MKVSMHDTIRDMVLWARSKDSKYKDKDGEIFVVRAGAGLSKLPDDMDWTTVTKMSLMNNEIGGIPDDYEFSNPDRLVTLFLQNNKLVNNVGNFFSGPLDSGGFRSVSRPQYHQVARRNLNVGCFAVSKLVRDHDRGFAGRF